MDQSWRSRKKLNNVLQRIEAIRLINSLFTNLIQLLTALLSVLVSFGVTAQWRSFFQVFFIKIRFAKSNLPAIQILLKSYLSSKTSDFHLNSNVMFIHSTSHVSKGFLQGLNLFPADSIRIKGKRK